MWKKIKTGKLYTAGVPLELSGQRITWAHAVDVMENEYYTRTSNLADWQSIPIFNILMNFHSSE